MVIFKLSAVRHKKREYISKRTGLDAKRSNIGYGIHISLSNKDYPLLEEIDLHLKKYYNFIKSNQQPVDSTTLDGLSGNLYNYPEKDNAVLAYTKLSDIEFLIRYVFNKYPLVTINQRKRLNVLKEGVLNKKNRVNTNPFWVGRI